MLFFAIAMSALRFLLLAAGKVVCILHTRKKKRVLR